MSRHKGHGSKIVAPRAVMEFMTEVRPAPYAIEKHEDVVKLQNRIEELGMQLSQVRKDLHGAQAALKTMCPHAAQRIDSQYYERDYYNRAYTEWRVVCMHCGADLFTHEEVHMDTTNPTRQ